MDFKMSRDKNLLKNVSDLFSEKVLQTIVAKVINTNIEENIEIVAWNFGAGSAKGDNYLSNVSKATVRGKKDDEIVDVQFFVKSLPKNIGRRNTYRSTDFFENEIKFYREIIPRFEQFLKSKGMSSLLCVPKCLTYLSDGEHDFLVLEDVNLLGFGSISRQQCIDYKSCCSILLAVARFHGISFAYKDQERNEFSKITNYLVETYFRKDLWKWYERFHADLLKVAKDALAKEYPGSEAEKRFNSYKFGEFYTKNIELCSRENAPTSIVTHGDCWAPNFLIRNLSQDKQQVMMLDFQLARCSSPVFDISFIIYSCTDKALRDEYFDNLLKIYYDELSKTILQLGSDSEKLYPWNVFMQEVKEQFIYGLTFALEALPVSMTPESDTPDLDALVKGDDAMNVADVWSLSGLKNKEDRCRLADIIVHAVQNDFI